MKKLLVLQPYLYSYRKEVFNSLSRYYKVTIVSEQKVKIANSDPICFIRSDIKRLPFGIFFQTKAVDYSLIKDSDLIWIPLDLSNLSYALAILLSILSKRKIILHTQGNYRQSQYSILRIFLLRIILTSAGITFYYAKSCFKEPYSKIKHRYHILNNRYESLPVPEDYEPSFSMSGNLLFIGRLRKRSGIISTCIMVEKLLKHQNKLVLNIIGEGAYYEYISNRFCKLISSGNIVIHGSINDYSEISDIAKNCSIGVYLGDAGLSILHYMALGLCPIVHNNLISHMGPEPSFLVDGENSKLVEFKNKIESASNIVRYLQLNKKELYKIQKRAFEDAKKIHASNLSNEIYKSISRQIT